MTAPSAAREVAAGPFPARPAEAPFLGVGVGLRPVHYEEVLARAADGRLKVDWLEVVSENYMIPGGRPLRILSEVREAMPLVLHGVSMNLGSVDPLDTGYLDGLAATAGRFEPAWLSDHLCWTGVGGHNLHDLLPLPYTEEAIEHVAARIRRVQDRIGRRIALENVSSYMSFADDAMTEWEFLSAIAEHADCGILLDVNNVFVSAHNHGFDPMAYLDAIDATRIFQIHLAGHRSNGTLLIDTHDQPICDEVWALYSALVSRTGPISTLIEWDGQIPEFDRLEAEAETARELLTTATRREDARAGSAASAHLAAGHGA